MLKLERIIAGLALGSALILQYPAYAQDAEKRVLRLPQDIVLPDRGSVELYGDSTKSGLYVNRGKIPSGAKNVPHRHPEERTVVILSGTLYYGLGEVFDESKLIAFPAGTFFSEPPGVAHFAWAKDGDVILQVTGIGPTGTTPVRPQ